jgi:hypothetical protein
VRLPSALLVAVLLVTAVAAGCAGATEPIEDPEVPLMSTPPPPGATRGRTVPSDCAEVSTPAELGEVLNVLVSGQVLPVVGIARENIGRTARLDCYFGVPEGQPKSRAAVWIALASYTDATQARRRLTDTAADEREAGARVSDVPVGADRGVLLRSTTAWTLVAARGNTTAVVTVAPGLVREDRAGAMLGQVADLVLTPRR